MEFKHVEVKTPFKFPGRTLRKTKTCFEFGVGPDYLFEMLQEFQVENLKGVDMPTWDNCDDSEIQISTPLQTNCGQVDVG